MKRSALTNGGTVTVRKAQLSDLHNIRHLYLDIYEGKYPLSIITDANRTKEALQDPRFLWLVAEDNTNIIGSVIFQMDRSQVIGHVFGAVVDPEWRGNNLTMQMMQAGLDESLKEYPGLIYATTRTLLPAPQILTERLGFVKLGIFPNVRRVKQSETHCLAAKFSPECLAKRRTVPKLHSDLAGLYELVRGQMNLESAKTVDIEASGENTEPIEFEIITAPNFIRQRYYELENRKELATTFYPFEVPNLLLYSADTGTEVFLYRSMPDLHCAVIAEKLGKGVDYRRLLDGVSMAVDGLGIRYIEILINAYEPELHAEVLRAGYLPTAYIPGMRLVGDERLDYIVFMRTFEMLDFYRVKLQGIYKDFLKEFLKLWKKYYVDVALGNIDVF